MEVNMQIKNRQKLLLVSALLVIGLFVGDKVVLSPLINSWKARSEKIKELRTQISDGTKILRREEVLRETWGRMEKRSLTNNPSAAEQQFFRAVDQWARDSRVTVSAITPQWKRDADDYMTYQCRLDASGDINTLSRFLFNIQNDPMALRMDSIEIAAHDKQGQQLTLGLQISGLVLNPPTR